MKFKLAENLPVSAASVLAAAGHDVDTVPGEHLAGRPDQDVVAASTAAQRVLISLDVGLGDIRAYPPGSHAGIVILRLAESAVVTISHPSELTHQTLATCRKDRPALPTSTTRDTRALA